MCLQRNNIGSKDILYFKKFFDLWKDADPGLSEVDDVKEALKRLAVLRE